LPFSFFNLPLADATDVLLMLLLCATADATDATADATDATADATAVRYC